MADLLDGAAQRRADRQRREAAQSAEEQARREKTRPLAREQRLDELARTEDAAWSRVDAMIDTRKPAEYDGFVAVSSGFGDQVSVVPAWRVDEGVSVSLAA